jgi:hypothetical protein
MKKFLKFLKYCAYTVIIIVVLALVTIYVGHKFVYPIPYSATTTIPDIKEDGFCFGVNCQNAPKTVDAFIPIFANQIKNDNKISPALWPENRVVNLYAAVQSIEHNKSWLISPDGTIKTLTKNELKELCPQRPRYNIGFAPFKSAKNLQS